MSESSTSSPDDLTRGAEVDFWDTAFANPSNGERAFRRFDEPPGETERAFMEILGDVNGLDVLDIGCGLGGLTVALAKRGARVVAIDTAGEGVRHTLKLAETHGVADRVRGEKCSALEIGRLSDNGFDLVVGSFILHHIEPFQTFADVLQQTLRPAGRGVFVENNARNPMLMFARKHIAGHFGIPRYGDDEERPLDSHEIEVLRESFSHVRQHYPDLIFFRKLNTYLLRGKFSGFGRVFRALDRVAYRVPMLRAYSYKQIVEIAHPKRAKPQTLKSNGVVAHSRAA